MHRASSRQAELDAQVLRERRLGRRLIAAPETYTALAARPGKALLGGVVVSGILAMVVSVVAVAGSARAGRQREDRPPSAQATAPAASQTTGGGDGPGGTATTAGAEAAGGAATTSAQGGRVGNDREGGGQVRTTVSFGPDAVDCQAASPGIEIVPLFTDEGVIGRIELAGFEPECVGRDLRLSLLGPDGDELASRVFVLQRAEPLSVGGWRQERPRTRDELGEVALEIL